MSEAARALGLPQIDKGKRLSGETAARFTEQVVEAYVKRLAPMRLICEATDRSFGAIHKLLSNAKVTMRARGYQSPQKPAGSTAESTSASSTPKAVGRAEVLDSNAGPTQTAVLPPDPISP